MYQTNLHMICNVAGGFERDGHTSHAVTVSKLEGVVDGTEQHPRKETDVGHAIEEFPGPLGGSVARRVEQPRQVPVHCPANRGHGITAVLWSAEIFSLSVAWVSTFFLQGCETADEGTSSKFCSHLRVISPFLKLVPVLQLLLLMRHCHLRQVKNNCD